MEKSIDNIHMIYKILHALDKAMDRSDFSLSEINASELGVSDERWARYIEMLYDSGLIKGVRVYTNSFDELRIEDNGIKITLKGLEYLSFNNPLNRVYRTIKGVADTASNIKGSF